MLLRKNVLELTQMHSKRPKLSEGLAILTAIGLNLDHMGFQCLCFHHLLYLMFYLFSFYRFYYQSVYKHLLTKFINKISWIKKSC